jgi:PTS system mannose-specific IIB component/fructoselysine and glucoselysine-specific PTS system IIB component
MPIELIRIDERLLHGQVVVGWGERLGLSYYVVVDDDLAESDWEQELYAGGLPAAAEAYFLSEVEAARRFRQLDGRPGAGALLARTTAAMRRLAETGVLSGRTVNVGCLGAAPDRRRSLDYVYLSPDEAADLRVLAGRAQRVEARDVPSAQAVALDRLLEDFDA